MNKKRTSKQDRLRKKISDAFVGRDEPITLFRRHLDAKPGEDGFYDIFNIFGQGGVGKSYLIKKFQTLAQEKGIITSYTDEGIRDSLRYMNSVAEQLEKQDVHLEGFTERYKKFLQAKQKLEADPEAPKGLLSLFTDTLVKGGLGIAEEIPVASGLVKMVDKEAWAGKAGELAEYIKKRWSHKDEIQLLLEPLKVLTPLFLEELMKAAEKIDVYLFIDTYEETSFFLDEWLRDILNGKYGDIPDNLVLVISGQIEVNPNDWASFNPFKRRISLEPFAKDEAIQFLHKKNINNPDVISTILKLSFCLPIMLAMLADEAPTSPEEITDFSKTAVDHFLKWIKDPDQRQLALHAALPRRLDKDVVKRLLSEEVDSSSLFDWLIKRPFVQHRGGIWTYHPVVRDLMLQYLQRSSPEEWETLHVKIADYYHQRAELLSIEDREARFRDEKWQALTQEKCYHTLSANIKQEMPESIRNFVTTCRLNGFNNALPWVEIIKQCSEICDDPYWGSLLQTGIDSLRYKTWEDALQMVSKINDAHLLIDQDDQSFHYLLEGFINSFSNNNKKAIECYQKAIKIKPDDDAWFNMGNAYGQLDKIEKAIECYQKAIEIKPDKDKAWHSMGWEFLKLGIFEKAENALLKAWEYSSNKMKYAPMNLGHIYLFQGRQEKAMEWYQTSLALWKNKEEFFQDMRIDFSNLVMEKHGISQQDFDAILATLKKLND